MRSRRGSLPQPLWGRRTRNCLLFCTLPLGASCAGHACAHGGHPTSPERHPHPSPSLLPPRRARLFPQEAQGAQPEPPAPAPCQGQHPHQSPLPSDPRLAPAQTPESVIQRQRLRDPAEPQLRPKPAGVLLPTEFPEAWPPGPWLLWRGLQGEWSDMPWACLGGPLASLPLPGWDRILGSLLPFSPDSPLLLS